MQLTLFLLEREKNWNLLGHFWYCCGQKEWLLRLSIYLSILASSLMRNESFYKCSYNAGRRSHDARNARPKSMAAQWVDVHFKKAYWSQIIIINYKNRLNVDEKLVKHAGARKYKEFSFRNKFNPLCSNAAIAMVLWYHHQWLSSYGSDHYQHLAPSFESPKLALASTARRENWIRSGSGFRPRYTANM